MENKCQLCENLNSCVSHIRAGFQIGMPVMPWEMAIICKTTGGYKEISDEKLKRFYKADNNLIRLYPFLQNTEEKNEFKR